MLHHVPVMLNESIDYLTAHTLTKGIYVDCTFGAGGYSKALLEMGVDRVIAIDRDSSVASNAMLLKHKYKDRFEFYNVSFDQIGDVLTNYNGKVAGIVYDIGVSSMQIDTPSRGFSFQAEGPLDMRMDQNQSLNAYDVINNYPEIELARIFFEYGDEGKSRVIAKKVVESRGVEPIATTIQLVNIIKQAIGFYRDDINPATKTFQAIRIEVNKELEQLKTSLLQAKSLLKIGGRMVVVSFHSGEDKIVKKLFNDWCGKKANLNKYLPAKEDDFSTPQFKFLHKGIVIAGNKEIKANVRARSARLRAIEKLVL